MALGLLDRKSEKNLVVWGMRLNGRHSDFNGRTPDGTGRQASSDAKAHSTSFMAHQMPETAGRCSDPRQILDFPGPLIRRWRQRMRAERPIRRQT